MSSTGHSRDKIGSMYGRVREVLAAKPRLRAWLAWGAVVALFGLVTWFYMGNALTHCRTDILTDGPGDSTAGLTWLTWIDHAKPIPSFTHLTNAPFGESLLQPFHITAVLEIGLMWAFSKLTTALCGWNLLVFTGYMSSALVMYAFARWLTKNAWVALFAGFALTFTPYHQAVALGHVSYMFNAIFVLMLWAFVVFWRQPTVKRAAVLALTTGACAYIDGYYILLGGVLVVALVLGALLAQWRDPARDPTLALRRLKGLVVYAALTVVLMAPVVLVQVKYSSRIASALASSRAIIANEAQTYGARPFEYFLPAAYDPLLPVSYQFFRVGILHGSNFSENTIYLGAVVVALVAALGVWVVRRRRDLPEIQKLPLPFWLTLLGTVFVVAVAVSLPPKMYIGQHPVPMPSWFIIHVTALWRVFARLYLVANTAFVVLGSLGLYLIIRKWAVQRQVMVVGLLMILMGVDFASGSRALVWSYSDAPANYGWLKQQPDIQTIAEYPLHEPPAAESINYLTYQLIDGKARINTSRSDSPQRALHLSIMGLADAQTLPVLRALGVQAVLQHEKAAGDLAGLTLVRQDRSHYNTDAVWTYRLGDGERADYVVVADTGFHQPILADDKLHSRIGMGNLGTLSLQQLGSVKRDTVHVSLMAQPTTGNVGGTFTVSQRGIVRWQGELHDAAKLEFEADPSLPLDIVPLQPKGDETLRIYDMKATD